MRKLFYLFLMLGMVAVSCKKPADIPTTQDVVFKATSAATGNFKDGVTDCVNPVAHYALIDIDGTTHTVDVFYLAGVIYTNTLKLDPGMHTINSFVLQNDNGTPGDFGDDVLVQATPLVDSEYENFVQMPLPFDFEVDAFFKAEVNIEILCFVPNDYQSFGFAWFTVEEVIVREVCFYGDFCTKYYEDYGQSLYGGQINGVQHDMPAIFKIDVFRNGDWVISYDNEEWLGEGAPLCVKYPDFKNVKDSFEFKLSILVKVGDDFEYVAFHSFTNVDAEPLEGIGEDNVMDFVLGSCVTEADLVLAPYMNLPATAILRTGGSVPGTENTYFDVTLSDIGDGFDIQNGIYGVFCGDNNSAIQLNTTYAMNVFSSLYLDDVPASFNLQKDVLDNINWLGNNLYRYDGYVWQDVQNAVWMILGQITETEAGVGVPSTLAIKMKNDALDYGDGYNPPVGGYAAVLFISPEADETERVLQLLFTLVDP